ncbi:MAG: hypothetical protein QNK23_00495 [Crocinitomicaceae bacterium]|nr:hypothetical protein [Crocinitomicaceae bacterium]
MGKAIIFLFSLALLVSCKKDQTPEPCTGISMTGEREMFVGTWSWHGSLIKESFDIGLPVYHLYTPQTQGFEYYCTIGIDGTYKGYQNGLLIHDLVLNEVFFENLNASITDVIDVYTNCSNERIDFRHQLPNPTIDSIEISKYPYQFVDEENKLESLRNYFVKQ